MYVFTLCVHDHNATLFTVHSVRSSEIEADGSEKLKRVFIRLHHALALVILPGLTVLSSGGYTF